MARQALDATFIDQQQAALLQLREQVEQTIKALHRETSYLIGNTSEPHDEADEAVDNSQIDIDERQLKVETLRLEEIDRALMKIEKGTYGYCESSGEPIARARLEVLPTAQYSLQEKQRLEKQSQ